MGPCISRRPHPPNAIALPFAERLVGGDEDRAALVACADELEQHAGLGLVLGDVGEIVKDQELEPVETVDGGLEGQFATGDLELLDEVGGSGEEDLASVLDEGEPDRRRQVALSPAGWAEQEQVGALGEPAVAGGHRYDLGLGDHRHGVEVEAVEGLSGRQSRLGEMALDAAPVSFCELMLGDRREEARGLPAFLVGLVGELRPDELDRGKAQLAEHDAEARGVDGGGRPHAASPVWPMPTRAS